MKSTAESSGKGTFEPAGTWRGWGWLLTPIHITLFILTALIELKLSDVALIRPYFRYSSVAKMGTPVSRFGTVVSLFGEKFIVAGQNSHKFPVGFERLCHFD